MYKYNSPLEPAGAGGLVLFEALQDSITAQIAPAHFRIRIVCIRPDPRREIDQLPAESVSPGGDRIIPPLIGRYKIMRAGSINAEGMNGREVAPKIDAEAVGGDEGAVSTVPIGVEQVGVGVGT